MPQISKKVLSMPFSPIRKLVPFADQAEKDGKNVYYLNIGQPDIQSPPSAIQALKNWEDPILSYTRSEGTIAYREALLDYFTNSGISNLSIDNFLVTQGGSEAMSFIFSSIADPGDEIIIPEPFYANYNAMNRHLDLNLVPITSTIEDEFSLPSIASFEDKITDKTRAILICHPGNPTGYMYNQEELEELKKLVIKHDLFLISDEVYREFAYDSEHISILTFPELKQNAIVIDSESKRYSMCGIRLGSIISRNTELLKNTAKFAQARLSPNLISQTIATAAHKDSSTYLDDAKKKYQERRNFIVKELNEIDGVYVPMPKGAFYCVAKLPVASAEDFALWMLEHFEYEGDTVMMAPMEGFYASPQKGLNEVRIAYVLDLDNLKKAVKCIKQGLATYPKALKI